MYTNYDMKHRDEIQCPICQSKYFEIENDIPIHKKILELWLIGFILPKTQKKYDNMIYHCKKCGTIWNDDNIIKKGENKNLKVSPFIPITIGILSILFSIVFALIAFTVEPILKIFLMSSFCLVISAGIVSLISIGNERIVKISCGIYTASIILFIIMFLFGRINLIPSIILFVFFQCMKLYGRKIS